MILLADSGSTKCDWVLLDAEGEVCFKTSTSGLNPAVLTREELIKRISANETLKKVFERVETIDFYGAGCGTLEPRRLLEEVLISLFPKAEIQVFEDMAAAVYAVTTKPGIVCILGTGSNSCYFDGKDIHTPIASLGYSIMDEASGCYFGRELIRDYYFGRMPAHIARAFESNFNLDADEIKLNLYKRPHPNAYMASFARFLFENEDEEIKEPYFCTLIKRGFETFIDCRVLTFENASELPIHFVGSIAYFSRDILQECLEWQKLTLGTIVQRPIDGLIEYYRGKL